jgi:hypothetical protein
MICMRIYKFEMPQHLDIPVIGAGPLPVERCLACEAVGSPPVERASLARPW